MGTRAKLSGVEVDAFSWWRRFMKFRPRERKTIKAKFWRRQRVAERSRPTPTDTGGR